MRKGVYTDTTVVSCRHCKEKYDVNKASAISEKMKRREIICPHCRKRTGTLN